MWNNIFDSTSTKTQKKILRLEIIFKIRNNQILIQFILLIMETESNNSEDSENQNHMELINYIQDRSESLLTQILIKLVLEN